MTRVLGDADAFVPDALRGFARAHEDEISLVDGGVVRANPLEPGKVAVLIGGGSGHYPAFAGYVGAGLAAGAVCGNIFTSPSTAQALRVAHAADAGGGILFTYGRYAGDVIHFGEAERRLRDEGIDARTVLITDDVASAPMEAADERRGIAGIVCVFHIAGAAAERGDPLDEVERLAARANSRTRSHGVAFAGCTLPGADHALFEVPAGQMSIGLGIHGEPGVRDVPLQPAAELAVTLAAPLLEERPHDGRRAAVIVNGLGSVKYEELFVLFGYVVDHLEAQGVEIVEPLCGEFVTSLDMAGVSLTLLWLDDELEELWRAPASAPALRKGRVSAEAPTVRPTAPRGSAAAEPAPAGAAPAAPATPASRRAAEIARRMLVGARDAIAAEADRLGELDAIAGDGDHGIGMTRGLTAAVEAAESADAAIGVRELLQRAGDAWSETAGGTSGALWGAALAEVGLSLGSPEDFTAADVATAVAAAHARVAALGGAEPGDKTMLDAMAPFDATLTERVHAGSGIADALAAAATAARAGAGATSAMSPRRGRARPLAERSIGHPDPGAVSFSIIAAALAGWVADFKGSE
ncbi:dihydroxyacetone kinase family protein [Microbacterium trichothecenolyticum]|uniref:dihydroxyacetone kinase family protein n=1 Tax=Microbacterium trichothecenolyticum TaxID=69370 RepID=UPI001C6EBA12|nr:dihydroxyacetone kinase family protein [Microbacterium trichothecenolyticum]MBW9119725.1 dihydroxyacetone kinase family protein [Microbacterium trichothecenolyticum]